MFDLERFILKSLKDDPQAWVQGAGAYDVWMYKHRVGVQLRADSKPWRVAVGGVVLGYWSSKFIRRKFKKFAKRKALSALVDAMMPREEKEEAANIGGQVTAKMQGVLFNDPASGLQEIQSNRAQLGEVARKLGVKI